MYTRYSVQTTDDLRHDAYDETVHLKTIEDMQLAMQLLHMGQQLCEQAQGDLAYLCDEVKRLSQDRAYLHLGHTRSNRKDVSSVSLNLTLPIQFSHIVYGTLGITSDPLCKDRPSIPMPAAQLLGQICSWLLYTIEQSSFLRGQCRSLDYHVNGPLTKRERQVLLLMCRGHGQEAIANLLCIAPATVGKHRQHIYEQLGVHCERDALLAAYQTGLFSIIDPIG